MRKSSCPDLERARVGAGPSSPTADSTADASGLPISSECQLDRATMNPTSEGPLSRAPGRTCTSYGSVPLLRSSRSTRLGRRCWCSDARSTRMPGARSPRTWPGLPRQRTRSRLRTGPKPSCRAPRTLTESQARFPPRVDRASLPSVRQSAPRMRNQEAGWGRSKGEQEEPHHGPPALPRRDQSTRRVGEDVSRVSARGPGRGPISIPYGACGGQRGGPCPGRGGTGEARRSRSSASVM